MSCDNLLHQSLFDGNNMHYFRISDIKLCRSYFEFWGQVMLSFRISKAFNLETCIVKWERFQNYLQQSFTKIGH